MVVKQVGYLKLSDVLELKHFSIYKTNKDTHILVLNTSEQFLHLYYPKYDRLPYKVVDGKKICSCEKIYDSKTDSNVDISKWNNGNQIMSYEEYQLTY